MGQWIPKCASSWSLRTLPAPGYQTLQKHFSSLIFPQSQVAFPLSPPGFPTHSIPSQAQPLSKPQTPRGCRKHPSSPRGRPRAWSCVYKSQSLFTRCLKLFSTRLKLPGIFLQSSGKGTLCFPSGRMGNSWGNSLWEQHCPEGLWQGTRAGAVGGGIVAFCGLDLGANALGSVALDFSWGFVHLRISRIPFQDPFPMINFPGPLSQDPIPRITFSKSLFQGF